MNVFKGALTIVLHRVTGGRRAGTEAEDAVTPQIVVASDDPALATDVPSERPAITLNAAAGSYSRDAQRTDRGARSRITRMTAKLLTGADGRRWHLDGRRHLHTLTVLDISALVAARQKEGHALPVIRMELGFLRRVLRHAEENGFRVNPELTDRIMRAATTAQAASPS
jgi:hypothetical protein